ncbi:MAG: class A beta-lactamase [Curvibacter sp.]|nr:class A beta-lactamase [Curvibacter sp.]
MLQRRDFHRLALLAGSALLCGPAPVPAALAAERLASDLAIPWKTIEAESQGRLGAAVLDTARAQVQGHRLDERFPMCSTFKWLAAASVLQRVDQGHEQLARRIRFGRQDLQEWSPATEKQVDGQGMTLAELCEAAITLSDNTAGNLILDAIGGPEGLSAFARLQGDPVTRLDRREPDLNQSLPGDPRDTTSPRAMAGLLQRLALGPALSDGSRGQLQQWLQATRTNTKRLAAGLPPGWRLGSKTGTGPHGSTNDVGVYWPPAGAPVVVAVYLTGSKASLEVREAALARVAQAVFQHFGG